MLLFEQTTKQRKIMNKTATIRARIEPSLKEDTECIFKRLGLTATQAITLFYKQVELKKGLPFDVVVPNELTVKTFSETDNERNLVVCEHTEDMFNKLGI